MGTMVKSSIHVLVDRQPRVREPAMAFSNLFGKAVFALFAVAAGKMDEASYSTRSVSRGEQSALMHRPVSMSNS